MAVSMDSRGVNRSACSSSGGWDCSICTYTNTREAFKCGMCEARKGTSTRKVRQSDDVIAQQQAAAALVAAQRSQELAREFGGVIEATGDGRPSGKRRKKKKPYSRPAPEVSSCPVYGESNPDVAAATVPLMETSTSAHSWNSPPAVTAESHHRSVGHARPAKAMPSVVHRTMLPAFRNVDRSSGVDTLVAVNGLEVTVTEYQIRPLLAVAPMRAVPSATLPQFKAVGSAAAQAYAAHKSGGLAHSGAPSTSTSGQSLVDVKQSGASTGTDLVLEATGSLPVSPATAEGSASAVR
eukprot:scpid64439/ scgid30156/ YY1-associated factor 2